MEMDAESSDCPARTLGEYCVSFPPQVTSVPGLLPSRSLGLGLLWGAWGGGCEGREQ